MTCLLEEKHKSIIKYGIKLKVLLRNILAQNQFTVINTK